MTFRCGSCFVCWVWTTCSASSCVCCWSTKFFSILLVGACHSVSTPLVFACQLLFLCPHPEMMLWCWQGVKIQLMTNLSCPGYIIKQLCLTKTQQQQQNLDCQASCLNISWNAMECSHTTIQRSHKHCQYKILDK